MNRSDETVSRIGASGSVEAVVDVGHGVSTIEDVGGVPWVGHQDAIEKIDPEDPTSSDVIATGAVPADIAFGDGRVWVVTEPSLTEHSGGTLRIILGDGIDSLDPARAYIAESWRVLDALNDGLVAYGGPGGRSLVANLATGIPTPSDGGKTYVFRLREGIRFSTGEELDSDDVRHSFERILGSNEDTTGLFSSIVGARSCKGKGNACDLSRGIVVSEDRRTVTFHLSYADPDFIGKLATGSASILPTSVPHKIQKSVPSTGPYGVVSNGPTELVLERRDDFRPWSVAAQPAGYADRIIIETGSDEESATSAVLAGEADWTDLLSSADAAELGRRFGSQIHVFPQLTTFAVSLNTTVAPFDDAEVRRAVNLAVDREKVEGLFGGAYQASLTCQSFPPGIQGYEPYCPYTADPLPSGTWRATDPLRGTTFAPGERTCAGEGLRVHHFGRHRRIHRGGPSRTRLSNQG